MTTTAEAGRGRWVRPLSHFTERSALGLLLVLAVGAGFGLLLLLVRGEWAPLHALDHGAAADLNAYVSRHPPAVTVLQAISYVGGPPLVLWLIGLVVAGLFLRGRSRLALYPLVTGLGAAVLDPTLKVLVGRLRPVVDIPVASAPGNSFPSGHALGSVVVYGSVLLVFLPVLRPVWRRVAVAAWALLVVAVGFSRVALGVHFVSDVLGGWLLGLAWLGVTAYAFRDLGRPAPPVTEGLDPSAAPDLHAAPGEHRLLPHPWVAAAEILTGWVLVFGVLYGVGVLVSRGVEVGWDTSVPRWFAAHRTPALDDLSRWWGMAGDTYVILLVGLAASVLAVAAWRQWRPVLFIALVMVGEVTLFLASAAAVGRPRPPVENLDGQMATSSFPSGHLAAALCVWVAIAILIMSQVRTPWRWIPVVLAVVIPAGVALSRMYRGMHHPTDVLGAVLLTVLWIGLLHRVFGGVVCRSRS